MAGRQHHLVAAGTSNGDLIVFKILSKNLITGVQLEIPTITQLWSVKNDLPRPVRVKWNTFGSYLVSYANDGKLNVWKHGIKNEFSKVAILA